MKSKSFFALLLAVYAFFGAMVFSQSETATTKDAAKPTKEDLSTFIPDMQLLSIFQTKEEELDALGASRSRFTDITKTLLGYQNMASQRRFYQEKALEELHTLQNNIKNNKTASEIERRKLEKDITLLGDENFLLEKQQEETKGLLKKYYQQGYIEDVQGNQKITLMSLLLPKSF
ncbi:MAG: hypothetical protein WCK88_03490 [bacterium]